MLKNLIDGRFESAAAFETIPVLNPSTGEKIAEIPDSPEAAVEQAIIAAKRAQPAWSARPAIERAGYLHRIAGLIREKRASIASTIAREQGKVLPLAETKVDFRADYVDYMAEWARRIEGEIIPSDSTQRNHPPISKAGRRRRRHSALKFPLLPLRSEDGSGPDHRQHDRHQAERGNSAECGNIRSDRH
jgi:acyl-CoA reductase-like NAD-dependent aldehyde dehydrogenase